jgi:hypothetical protein
VKQEDVRQLLDRIGVLRGFLVRTQNPTHTRMYVFRIGSSTGGWLPMLLELASTRDGRLDMLAALSQSAPNDTGEPVAKGIIHVSPPGRRNEAAACGPG